MTAREIAIQYKEPAIAPLCDVSALVACFMLYFYLEFSSLLIDFVFYFLVCYPVSRSVVLDFSLHYTCLSRYAPFIGRAAASSPRSKGETEEGGSREEEKGGRRKEEEGERGEKEEGAPIIQYPERGKQGKKN